LTVFEENALISIMAPIYSPIDSIVWPFVNWVEPSKVTYFSMDEPLIRLSLSILMAVSQSELE
jgi:hypothetical protein